MRAIICVGVSASGKSTFARKMARDCGFVKLDRDDMRFSLTCSDNWGEYRFNRKLERAITEMQIAAFYSLAASRKDIVIAETNLNPKTRKFIFNLNRTNNF